MLKLMYITNRPDIAAIAQDAGVDRIFVDLEIMGKRERQGHRSTVISGHSMSDITVVRSVVQDSELLVRVNPLYDGSRDEIDEAIARGADILMLPMFTTAGEVETFVRLIAGRARINLLLETPQALVRVDDILCVNGIDEIHIGLNDLHLGMRIEFMFELLSGGIVEYLCQRIRAAGISYGFGGIARIGYGLVPAEHIIAEHYRLGSCMTILSRSFCDAHKLSADAVAEVFGKGVAEIREFEKSIASFSSADFGRCTSAIRDSVHRVVSK